MHTLVINNYQPFAVGATIFLPCEIAECPVTSGRIRAQEHLALTDFSVLLNGRVKLKIY